MELKLPGHKGIVRSIAFTHDDTTLLSGSTDCTLKVWDVQEGVEIRTLNGHKSAIYSLQVHFFLFRLKIDLGKWRRELLY